MSIYTICADELRKANIDLVEDGLSRESAPDTFVKGLAGGSVVFDESTLSMLS